MVLLRMRDLMVTRLSVWATDGVRMLLCVLESSSIQNVAVVRFWRVQRSCKYDKPYTGKLWQSLNLAKWPQMVLAKFLFGDLNAVRHMRACMR